MKCWESIDIPIDDVLITPHKSLMYSLLHKHYDPAEDYLLFPITGVDVFTAKFIDTLASVNLELFPWQVGFLVKPNTLGFPHCDYYGDTRSLEEHNTPIPVSKRSFYKISLHIDLAGVGNLEWFNYKSSDGKNLADSANIIETKTGVSVYEIDWLNDNFTKIDSLSGIGINVCKTNIPHRSVNLTGSSDLEKSNFRVVLTARFVGNPNFDTVVSKLKNIKW